MPQIAPLRLTGAQTLLQGALHDAAITVCDGKIGFDPAPEVDLTGYILLPGIIDLHGDGFERHLSPRPSAPFDKPRALASAASELAANGVTTAWLAQSWSWEGGFRSGEATIALLAALAGARPALLPDMRVQIRLETHLIAQHDAVLAAVRDYDVDYLVFNNHLPEALDMAAHQPDRFAQWASQTRRTPAEMLAIVRGAEADAPHVAGALQTLSAKLAGMGAALGSHDDADAQTRAFYRKMGARICEFPTSLAAAQSAKDADEPVLMGAPNVVRGGSQSGNIAAQSVIEAGLCDALVSDYYYPALSQAALHLVQAKVTDLPRAWAMISSAPARIAGLTDRGTLTAGGRADIAVLNPKTQCIEMTICAGRIAHLSGEVARRIWSSAPKGITLG